MQERVTAKESCSCMIQDPQTECYHDSEYYYIFQEKDYDESGELVNLGSGTAIVHFYCKRPVKPGLVSWYFDQMGKQGKKIWFKRKEELSLV